MSPVNAESENEPNRLIEIQIDGDREVRRLVPNRTPILYLPFINSLADCANIIASIMQDRPTKMLI
jgi:hypothetical protein